MSETVERNNRFYKQPDGKVLTENEQLKEWIVIANKHNEELQKERDMYKTSFETMSTNYFRLENIIKEVREYIENNKEYTTIKKATKEWQYGKVKFEERDEDILDEDMIKELLEILDKEVN